MLFYHSGKAAISCWVLILFSFSMQPVSSQTAYELAQQMFDRTSKIERLIYTMTKKERIDGQMLEQTSRVKLNINPLRIYSFQMAPHAGLEVMYREGLDNNEALVNPNGFPWFTLKLDPAGGTMRKNQHHLITHSGYGHFIEILKFLFDKYGEATASYMSYDKPKKWLGSDCEVIHFRNPNFKYVTYEVGENEDLVSICSRLHISVHMVIQQNEDIDDFDEDLDPGQKIQVPNDYSPEMVLYIDKNRLIPIVIRVFDNQGLYEEYSYFDVQINPEFGPDEFDPDHEDYDF